MLHMLLLQSTLRTCAFLPAQRSSRVFFFYYLHLNNSAEVHLLSPHGLIIIVVGQWGTVIYYSKSSYPVTGSLAGHCERVPFQWQTQRVFTVFFCKSSSKTCCTGQFIAAVGHSLYANDQVCLGLKPKARKLVSFTGTLFVPASSSDGNPEITQESRIGNCGLLLGGRLSGYLKREREREREREKLTERGRVVHLGPTFVDTLPLFELVAGFQPRGVGCFRHTSLAQSKAMHPTKKKRRR